LACQNLRAGECNAALAGGVNVISAPHANVALSRLGALSPDGRCKTFDASANGYARGEGAGIVVLKRLSDAQTAGDSIYAVIRGSATNHDGRSNGLTAPNGLAQEAVVRAALANGGVEPASVSYVEAHGTGTLLGDPIEVHALGRAYGEGRPADNPLYLGSVKTNLGHLEGAAGIASLIKAALCVSNRQLVASLHFRDPNPQVRWKSLPVEVVTDNRPWHVGEATLAAGVSSFGLSGTNAHVVLEEPPADSAEPAPTRRAELVVVSAKSDGALRSSLMRLRERVEAHPELSLGDFAFSLATTRSLMDHRVSFVARTRDELLGSLKTLAEGTPPQGFWVPAGETAKVAWLFSGQGAQQPGMGRALYREWPAFRDALDAALADIDQHLDRPLRDVMWATPGEPESDRLNQTAYTQPALFAVEWALAALWRSWGVQPDFVGGHSVGEIAAAAVAGVMTLADAARFVCHRGRVMQALPTGGAMVAIGAPPEAVAEWIAARAATVSIAAVNGPSSVVISGVEADVMAIADSAAGAGAPTKRLTVSHAFHSPLMDPALRELEAVARSIEARPPSIPMLALVRGEWATTEVQTPNYWVQHARRAVRFADGIERLRRVDANVFLEIGPSAVLLPMVRACFGEATPTLLPSLRAGLPEEETMLSALAGLVSRGVAFDPPALFPGGGRRLRLPTYAWQRKRYWIDWPEKGRSASPSKEAETRASEAPSIYEVAWRKIESSFERVGRGRWLLLGKTPDVDALASALGGAGCEAVVAKDIEELSLVLKSRSFRGLIHVAANETEMLAAQRALAGADLPKLQCFWITDGAVGTAPNDPPAKPEQAVMWGLGRTFALEYPQCSGGLIDRAPGVLDEVEARRLIELVLANRGEDQIALRKSGIFVPRLATKPLPPASRYRAPGGTIVVTGGLGGIGGHLARWLARAGARHLLLIGRRGARDTDAEGVERLRELGARVTVAKADVTDRQAMRAVFDALPKDQPIAGLFHAAGMSDTTPMAELTPARLADVLAAKREGTRVLAELTAAQPTATFVCISSIAGVWGSAGQGAYAGANAFLDAWAQSARAAGRAALSVSFGPWASGGMVDAASRARLERRGLLTMDPGAAIEALERVLVAGTDAHAVVADIDWETFRVGFEAWGKKPLLDEIPRPSGSAGAAVEPLRFSSLTPAEAAEPIAAMVRAEIAKVLGLGGDAEVSLDRPLLDVGFDSLMLVELRSAIHKRLGIDLPVMMSSNRTTPR
ncbi:MAG TPA: type I polyketide synthase, partial [Polyangiaceae bacterium]